MLRSLGQFAGEGLQKKDARGPETKTEESVLELKWDWEELKWDWELLQVLKLPCNLTPNQKKWAVQLPLIYTKKVLLLFLTARTIY